MLYFVSLSTLVPCLHVACIVQLSALKNFLLFVVFVCQWKQNITIVHWTVAVTSLTISRPGKLHLPPFEYLCQCFSNKYLFNCLTYVCHMTVWSFNTGPCWVGWSVRVVCPSTLAFLHFTKCDSSPIKGQCNCRYIVYTGPLLHSAHVPTNGLNFDVACGYYLYSDCSWLWSVYLFSVWISVGAWFSEVLQPFLLYSLQMISFLTYRGWCIVT